MMSLILAAALMAQEGAPELAGAGWVNTPRELKLENLKGKVVVLYFYEET